MNNSSLIRTFSFLLFATIIILLLLFALAFKNAAYFLASALLASLMAGLLSPHRAGFFVVLSSTLFSLLFVECILKFPQVNPLPDRPKPIHAADYGTMTDLGWQPNPGAYRSKSIAPDGSIIYDVIYSINSDRTRHTPDNPVIGSTVNFFGGSFVFGEGVQDDETLPYYFMKYLHNIRVKNWGFHAYGIHQALSILRSDRNTEGIANILVTAPFHIQRSACIPSWSMGYPRYIIGDTGDVELIGACPQRHDLIPLDFPILGDSEIYKILHWMVNKERRINESDIRLYIALIKAFKKSSAERNQKLFIGFIRCCEETLNDAGFSNDQIISTLRSISDGLIDITPNEGSLMKLTLHELDGHPSPIGHKLSARRLALFLEKQLGLEVRDQ